MSYCTRCGNKNNENDKYCNNCGERIDSTLSDVRMKEHDITEKKKSGKSKSLFEKFKSSSTIVKVIISILFIICVSVIIYFLHNYLFIIVILIGMGLLWFIRQIPMKPNVGCLGGIFRLQLRGLIGLIIILLTAALSFTVYNL